VEIVVETCYNLAGSLLSGISCTFAKKSVEKKLNRQCRNGFFATFFFRLLLMEKSSGQNCSRPLSEVLSGE
jgi:hypothetical protein